MAGPVEATALGNILVQALAGGYVPDIAAGRRGVAASEKQEIFEPRDSDDWDVVITRFDELLRAGDRR